MQSWINGDIFTARIKKKTLSAWEPWDFSRELLFSFQSLDIGEEYPEWRLYWFSGVTVLRTIGHVLHKIDSDKSQHHKMVITNAWGSWNKYKEENWIFFDFIEKERNNILKEFSFGAKLPTSEDGRTLAYKNTDLDAFQLYRESVYWWREQLNKIETAL